MKKTLFLLLISIVANITFAQAPQAFKYQAVIRDASGNILANQNVSFRISILQGSSNGTTVYSEEFSAVQTNEFGLINLNIGTGSSSGNFNDIDWAQAPYFLKVELDENGGSNYSEISNAQLLSIPYALYTNKANFANTADFANNVPTNISQLNNDAGYITSPDDNDADPTNEIQTISKQGNTVTLSNGGGSFTDDVNDNDADPANEIQLLNFDGNTNTLSLSNGGSVSLAQYSNIWQQHGSDIYYNNGYVGVGTDAPGGPMVVQGDDNLDPDSALFEVKNKDGQTIFAVYDGGVRIYVKDDTSLTRANNEKAGFAVGGYRRDKIVTNEYLRVTPDSVRIWINANTSANKANNEKAGFAVGGYRRDKSTPDYFLNIYSGDTTYIINPSEARILWYPAKNAFLAGQVLVESADSVGPNSMAIGYESKAIGDYSQAMGYKPRAKGNNSTAIGYNANSEGNNSYAFGNYATAIDSGSYAIGSGAKAIGLRSFALGSTGVDSLGNATAPTIARGDYSYALGTGCLSWNIGSFTIGTQDTVLGKFGVALGYQNSTGINSTFSVSIGSFNTTTKREALTLGRECTNNSTKGVAIGYKSSVTTDYGGTSIGYETKTTARYSTAIGYNAEANGFTATSVGNRSVANGLFSNAFGQGKAYGDYSTALAMYSYAYGIASIAIGGTARGKASKSFGTSTIARSYGEVVVGYNNDTTASINTDTWVDTDPIFIVGNGISARHNALTVLKNGNVGVNMTNPIYNLQVMGDDNLSSILITPNTNLNANAQLLLAEDNDYTYGMGIIYNGSDNILEITGKSGSSNYGPWLTISRNSGEIKMPGVYDDAVGSTNRDLYIDDSGKIGYLSSAKRFKKNITEMEDVSWMYKLKPVNYIYKKDKKAKKQYGLIAEDVEKVNPLFVSYNKNGIIETVNYSMFITPLIKLTQELHNDIEKLKQENNALKQSNAKLEKKINEINELKAEISKIKELLELKAEK